MAETINIGQILTESHHFQGAAELTLELLALKQAIVRTVVSFEQNGIVFKPTTLSLMKFRARAARLEELVGDEEVDREAVLAVADEVDARVVVVHVPEQVLAPIAAVLPLRGLCALPGAASNLVDAEALVDLLKVVDEDLLLEVHELAEVLCLPLQLTRSPWSGVARLVLASLLVFVAVVVLLGCRLAAICLRIEVIELLIKAELVLVILQLLSVLFA